APFAVTSIPDRRLGQALVLLIAGRPDVQDINNKLPAILEPYYRPKHIFATTSIPQTENGKTKRNECRALALQLFKVTENK
ncbi:AMP-binding enzyme, partial [Bacteroides heparinolyticus]